MGFILFLYYDDEEGKDKTEKEYKKADFNKGDYVDLKRFTKRIRDGMFEDPKTKHVISPEKAKNSGSGGHGGSDWKLFKNLEDARKGNKLDRLGTLDSTGKWVRK